MTPTGLTRRAFLELAGASTAGLVLPTLLRDPYRPARHERRIGSPVRVQGRVTASGRGLARVAVSDGLSVVETGADGTYELVTTVDRDFVRLSVPAGHAIPRNPTGTARFYRPVRANALGTMEASFELERLPDGDERHAVLLLADVQTQDAEEMRWFHEQTVPDVRDTVADMGERSVIGISCGDIMYDDLSLFPEYERGVERMGIPFFQVVGNHDLDFDAPTDEGSSETFSRHFGPRYYSFDRGAVHYVVLDDVLWHGAGYIGYLDADQLTWLAADLPAAPSWWRSTFPRSDRDTSGAARTVRNSVSRWRTGRRCTGCSSRTMLTSWSATRMSMSTCSLTVRTSWSAPQSAARGGADRSAATGRRAGIRCSRFPARRRGGGTRRPGIRWTIRCGSTREAPIRARRMRSSPTCGIGILNGRWCGTKGVTAEAPWPAGSASIR